MPWTTRTELMHQMVTLHQQGLSRRAIARALSVSRNTVRKLLTEHGQARLARHSAVEQPVRAPRSSKVDPFRAQVVELLERYPEITAQRIFEELRQAGFDGGYTAVKKHVRAVRPRPVATPSLPTVTHGPGEMAESDWSPFAIDFTVGGRETIQLFSYVLAYSTRKSYAVFDRCDLHALMDGHLAAFARFEGACGCRKPRLRGPSAGSSARHGFRDSAGGVPALDFGRLGHASGRQSRWPSPLPSGITTLRRGPLVSMMQAANLRQFDDRAEFGSLLRPGLWSIARQ